MTENRDDQTEFESRIAFMEHLLDQLNDVVTKQQDQMDVLVNEITKLREQLERPVDDLPQDERPPHY